MIAGDTMLRLLTILPSLVSVTFIGHGKLPKGWMWSLFRVRQVAVYEALNWLKVYNPKYYASVQIDGMRIARFPDNDIPIEILGVIRQSEDVAVIGQEAEGYMSQFEDGIVKENEMMMDEGISCVFWCNGCCSYFMTEDGMSADVVPLEKVRVMDTDMLHLSSNKMMMWAMANLGG